MRRGYRPSCDCQLILCAPKRTNRSEGEGSPAGAIWVSGMSEASAANPGEGAELCD